MKDQKKRLEEEIDDLKDTRSDLKKDVSELQRRRRFDHLHNIGRDLAALVLLTISTTIIVALIVIGIVVLSNAINPIIHSSRCSTICDDEGITFSCSTSEGFAMSQSSLHVPGYAIAPEQWDQLCTK